MPNWCYNKLIVSGPSQQLKRFVERVRSFDDAGNEIPLDFETLIPTPPELLRKQRKYDDKLHLYLKRITADPGIDNDDWYTFRVRRWGTKWNLDNETEREERPGEVIYTFNTAWSPPLPWIKTASEQFPDLLFGIVYDDPTNDIIDADAFRAGKSVEPPAALVAMLEKMKLERSSFEEAE
jgi:hypothetical protein